VSFSVFDLTFPDTPLGLPPQTDPSGQVNVFNSGTAAVNIQLVRIAGANANDFQLIFDSCNSISIPVGGACTVIVAFQPAAIGIRRASLQVFDDAAGGEQSVPLAGAGSKPVSNLQLFPTAIAFAPTGTASNEPAQVSVQNTGSEPSTINGFLVTGQNAPDFVLAQNYCQPIPYTLAVQSTCYLELQFTPGAVGVRLANLEVVDSAPGSPQVVPMEGFGVASTISLSFNPSPVTFGLTTLGQTNYGYVNLQNSGTSTAQISFQIKGIDAADFSVPSYCGSLGPGSCYVQLNFTPSASGMREATLVATDSVSGQSRSVVMVGSGVPSGVALSASTPSFTPVLVGNTSQGSFNVYSQSQSPVTITQVTLTGGAKSDFGIFQNGCPAGLVLNPNNSCTVQLTFTPSAANTRIAEINIGYSGGSGPLTVPLAGTGLPSTRAISFNTSSLDFGAIQIGSTQTISQSIYNTGNDPVAITAVSVAGTNAADYAIVGDPCPIAPATLPPYGNCYVSLQFTPSAVGTRLARLQVADNASGSPQSLSLVGFGINSAPALQIYGNVVNFSSQPLGSSSVASLTLQLLGAAPVTFSGFQIVGPNSSDFTLANNCPVTLLPPYAFCNVNITFTPSVTGMRVAELQIQDNATGSPQIIPLAGVGIKATRSISLSPIPLVFNPAGIGYPESASVQVSNAGTEIVLLTGFHVGGPAAKDFGIQSNDCPLSPAPFSPGNNCNLTIAFVPSATGIRLANFTVADNASGSPQSVSMVGEGVAAVKTLQVTPGTVTFSPTPVGTTNYDGGSVNVYNSGTVPVTFKSFGFSGPDRTDFSVENSCSLTLNPGYNCFLYLNFTPSATGTRTAQLTIESDATPSKQTVQLTGTGL